MGDIGKTSAEKIGTQVGELNDRASAGLPIDGALASWLAKISNDLHEKLVAAGLVAPRETAKLAEFVDGYIAGRTDAKPNTIRNFKNTRQKLTAYFGEGRDLRTITPGECDSWRQSLLSDKCSEAVISKAVKHARQFFKVALRRELVSTNPFADVHGGSERNDTRLRFIPKETIDRVLAACPDVEWQAIIALARYGGLRTPSETLSLKSGDINWADGRMSVPAPKTERHGKAFRVVPLFPELRAYLEAAYEAAADGTVYVIQRYRDSENANLRTQFLRILRRAGVEPWPRLFHNLRASRQTELADEYPAHVVAAWLGNSPAIAERHYLKTTEQHFERAITDKAKQSGAGGGAKVGQKVGLTTNVRKATETKKAPVNQGFSQSDDFVCSGGQRHRVPPTGVEPVLPD